MTLVYVTDNTYDGNLGGRVGADGICASEKPEVLNCSSLHALLSVNASDEIQDLPANYGFQSTQPLYFFCRERGWLTQFAESWADALDGSILVRPSTAMQGFYDQYWTGSNNLGALEPGSGSWDYLCVNWTATNANYSLGGEGNRSSTTSWLYASGKPQCTADLHLLCACRLQ